MVWLSPVPSEVKPEALRAFLALATTRDWFSRSVRRLSAANSYLEREAVSMASAWPYAEALRTFP